MNILIISIADSFGYLTKILRIFSYYYTVLSRAIIAGLFARDMYQVLTPVQLLSTEARPWARYLVSRKETKNLWSK